MIPVVRDFKLGGADLLGTCSINKNGRLEVTMAAGRELTIDDLWDTFGNAMIQVLEMSQHKEVADGMNPRERERCFKYKKFLIVGYSVGPHDQRPQLFR